MGPSFLISKDKNSLRNESNIQKKDYYVKKKVTRYAYFFIILGRGAKNQKTFVTGIARLKIKANVTCLFQEIVVIEKYPKNF